MNSRCICAAMRESFPMGKIHGNRMRIPGYPSNREADECVREATALRREGAR